MQHSTQGTAGFQRFCFSSPQGDAILDELATINLGRQREDELVVDFLKLWTDQVRAEAY